ncbi:MAG: ABC transporter ATP-binding protein [Atopobiaceae bacterium]|nr:ABC transporter ATP-binding protein [Atopobiaceae bacterium]
MATLSLRHVQKIYPQQNKEDDKRKRRKRRGGDDEPEVKPSVALKITDEGVVAVDDFNLEIQDKEFIVFVGPSGCGKSTTLRMIAGLEDITRGELYINGRLMNDVEPKDRDIAMVFQNYALYPHMSVRQNLEFPLEIRKVPKEEMDQKVEWAADVLGITPYLNRKPKALSGGQRQRVAIGRAIVRDPQVLLMDEPLSNLDAKLRNQMRTEIIKLRKRLNATFIYVTHDQTEAMTLGDRIVVMKDGDIQQIGTPQQLFDRPANLFVAGFIGMPQMNQFDGTLVRSGTRYALRVGEAEVALSDQTQKALAESDAHTQEVIVGVRPEHVLLDDTASSCIEGTVEVVEMMGSDVHLHVDVGGTECVIVAPRPRPGMRQVLAGSLVRFTFDPHAVHLFDPQTQKNLVGQA